MTLGIYIVLTVVGAVVLLLADFLDDLVGGWFDGGDTDVDGEHGVGWFSIKLVAVFITGFGASGAIAILKGVSGDLVWITGLAVGAIMAYLVRIVIVWLATQQGSSHYSVHELKGKSGRVTTTILPARLGEVSVRFRDASISKPAKAEDSQDKIDYGSQITVVDTADDVLIVRPIRK